MAVCIAAWITLGVLALATVPGAVAQVVTAPAVHSKVRNPKPKIDTFQGDVVSFTNAAITVRDRKNLALIRTFSYSPELVRKMENRRMEPGDRVAVRFLRGTDTAVELKGKIRKAN